jgi:hypothetical protein
MNDEITGGDLQFDRMVPQAGEAASSAPLNCGFCASPIASEYYDISGRTTCAGCHERIATLMETPRGSGPLVTAGLFGLAAGIAGAIIYYGVIALTHFEIGIVAILIGYMVGYSVRRGAGGRGGRRFQVMAVALTYLAVGLAYTPIAFGAAMKARSATQASAPAAAPAQRASVSPQGVPVKAFAVLVGIILALPVLVVVGGLPSSILSAAIIFFGMRQAWRMTGTPPLSMSGPYRVGGAPAVRA